jgi:O-antigen ligase
VVGTRHASRPAPAAAALIVGGALFLAAVEGALLAYALKPGVGLLVALLYGPLALIALPLGIALWVPLVFVADLPVVSVAPTAAGLLILIAWLGLWSVRRRHVADVLHRHRRLLAGMLVMLVWVSLSLAWAVKPGMGAKALLTWFPAVLVFIVVGTTIVRPRDVRVIVAAFVVGAALSVTVGLVNGGLSPAGRTANTATETEGRLQGGGGDPNYLAAGLVPALVLAGALAGATRSPALRWGMALAAAVIAVGYGATQSRGALVGAGVAVVAAFVVFKRHRAAVALFLVCIASVAGVWFAANPSAWKRVTDFNGGGNGRSEIWRTAWLITQDHPVVGVGLNNFRVYAPRYVRRPGPLKFVKLIADQPRVVHNTYLQVLVETGVIGLALFLAVILGCLATLWRAAKRFEQLGNDAMSTIARATLVAALGALAASFFLTNATDLRIWLLFGLGPALLAIARREEREQLAAWGPA